MSLDDIVNVTITAQTTSPTRKGFGIPLVAGYHIHWLDSRVRFYTSLAAMLTDGFVITDAIYKAAKAVFAQKPRPTKIAVGRLTTTSTMTVDCTPVVQNTHLYTVTLNGTAFTYTSDGSATAAEIVGALVTAINAGSVPVTASNVANVLHLVADVPGDLFDVVIDYRDFALADNSADTSGIAAQLAAISIEDDTWYGLVLVPRGAAEIVAAAGYIETVEKIAIFSSGDSAILDSGSSTDVAALIHAGAYARSATFFHRLPHEYAHAAWLGEELPRDPGSSTYAFKTLAGITVDVLTATEVAHLKTKKCNFYQALADVNITQDGVTGSGEFIDVTVFVDWLKAQMQADIYAILVNIPKIPYTDGGIALIEGAVRGDLRRGIDVGGLVDDDVLAVFVPAARDVAPADKAARILRDVKFQATLAGAIHSLILTGTISV